MEGETASYTGEEQPKKKGQFTKGDPRINRKGRPKSFDALRRLILLKACEEIAVAEGSPGMTRIEAIVLDWAKSDDPIKQRLFVEYGYGKVPNPVEMTGKGGAPLINISSIEAVKPDGLEPPQDGA